MDNETLHILAELKKPRKQRERERIARLSILYPIPFQIMKAQPKLFPSPMLTITAENATEQFAIEFFSKRVRSKYILWVCENDNNTNP